MRRLALAAAASLLATRGAHAQLRTAWDAAVAADRAPTAAGAPAAATTRDWAARPTVGGLLRLDAPLARLGVGGAAGNAAGAWSGAVELSGAVATPAWRGVRAGLSAAGRVGPAGDGGAALLAAPTELRAVTPGAPYAAADAHVSLRRGASGAWVGAEAQAERGDARGQEASRTLAMRLGVWRQLRGLTVSVSAGARGGTPSALRAGVRTAPSPPTDPGSGIDSSGTGAPAASPSTSPLAAIDTNGARATRHWAEVEARVGWARGRVALDGVVGARPRTGEVPAALWMQGSGAVGIAPGVAVVARGGALPHAPVAAGVGGRRFVALGVRLSPPALWRPAAPPAVRASAAGFAIRRLAVGRYLVTLRAPGARVVELSGDFTGWRPLVMRQVDLDTWELVTEIAPGPHRCNVRIDGEAWAPPPGTTAVDDDFNGRVGLIVVE